MNRDIAHYRSLFPYIETGRIYMDHAAVAPLCTPVVDAINGYLKKKSTADPNVFFDFLKVVVETKKWIGELINAPRDRIALSDNTSNGLNVLASGLKWKTGDRILLTDIEFPANVYPFLNQKRHGVEVDLVKNRNGRILLEDIERSITPRTRLLSISHVQFLHGFRSDLAAIGELCRKKNVVFCVDAIQSTTTIPVDVQAMKVDFLACGCQKWLLAPEGTAFLYVSEETQAKIEQSYLGWMGIKDFFVDFLRYRLDLEPTARRYENSTPNVAGIEGLHASLGLLREVGIPRVHQSIRALTQEIFEGLKGKQVELLTPEDPAQHGALVTFRPPDAKALFEKYKNERITISLREGCIRISPHFYNTSEEVRRVLSMVD